MSILALTYLLLRFVHLLSFLRSLFICPCGSHRHLFVICSFIVRLLFVFCSFIVRLLFVFCSSLRRCSSPFGGSQRKLGMCKGEVFFVFFLSARAICTVICSFIVRSLFVICSSHFSVTTLPLLGRGLGRGYFVRCLVACRTTTSYHHQFSIIGIIGIFDIITFFFTTLLKIPFHRYCLTHLPSSGVSK